MEPQEEYRAERDRMVRTQIEKRDVCDKRVLQALREVPRHKFLKAELRRYAYDDEPLSIGEGQTISQPYTVAYMTEALRLTGREKTLEIGTGSGYQTAILCELSADVYTVERLPELAERAKRRLVGLDYTSAHFLVGDGTLGLPEEAPYDAIIVTAGAPKIPEPLIEQLAEGGRLVAPVGGKGIQTMIRLTKNEGEIREENLGSFRFVNLIGEHGWKK